MNSDDPELTAYLLEEPRTAAERAKMERALRDDPALAAEADELRVLATRLQQDLRAEGPLELTPEGRARLLRAAETAQVVRPGWRVWLPTALAACFFVGGGVWFWQTAREAKSEQTWPLSPAPALPTPSPTAEAKPEPEVPPPAQAVTPEMNSPLPATPSASADHQAAASKSNFEGTLTTPEPPALVAEKKKIPDPAAIPGSAAVPAPSLAPAPTAANGSVSRAPAAAAQVEGGSAPVGSRRSREFYFSKPDAEKSERGKKPLLRAGETTLTASRNVPPPPPAERADDLRLEKAEKSAATSSLFQRERDGDGWRYDRPSRPATDLYEERPENPFQEVALQPLSTFSIDVDTASYTNVKRMLQAHQRPPAGSVRLEELVNYFSYDYPAAAPGQPCSVTMEAASCPWQPQHRLVRIGLRAREIPPEQRPPVNLVFLFDVSGSMQPANRLPLAVQSLRLLTDQLGSEDRVAIAVYAGRSGTVLEPTGDKGEIRAALERLRAGGSTNGASGIQLAYQLARKSFVAGHLNRVILCTDGDFNVGVTEQSELIRLIAREARSGVFLTILGFGYGNLQDSTLQKLADRGNGNYAYVNDLTEGRRVLVEQMSGTLLTVAKDVKLQVEFNPAQVSGYRLLGYEKRLLQNRDFSDDTKDAGEMGSGQTVTALYEIIPAGLPLPETGRPETLKYAGNQPRETEALRDAAPITRPTSAELLTLKLRWKAPESSESSKLEFPLVDGGQEWARSTSDFRFAAAVAGFSLLLRDSVYRGTATWESIRQLAAVGKGSDRSGYRQEFLSLLEEARPLLEGE